MESQKLMTHPKGHLPEDRYFDPDPSQRDVARELYAAAADLPLICPHGHVDPRLLADDHATFGPPADLLIIPDHYVLRMLYSQGIPLESLGVPPADGSPAEEDHRKMWWLVSANWVAGLVVRGIVNLDEAHEMILDLAYRLAKRAYRPGDLSRSQP